jgi:hypothetical protein
VLGEVVSCGELCMHARVTCWVCSCVRACVCGDALKCDTNLPRQAVRCAACMRGGGLGLCVRCEGWQAHPRPEQQLSSAKSNG